MKNLIILALLIIASALLVAFSTGESQEEQSEKRPKCPPIRIVFKPPGEESPEAQPERPAPAYVGARKCKVCHLDIYKSWEKTKHAWAFSALNDEELEDPGCLACHTTGFGRGGYGGKNAVANLGGVQCEACHGPGSLYSRSSVMRKPELGLEMGLVRVDSTTCATCHNSESPTFKGFAFQAGLSAGTHSRKRNKPD